MLLLTLDLLDNPRELYWQAGPQVRQMLNRTIFTKLKMDRGQVATDELAEPFDVIVPAGRDYEKLTCQSAVSPGPRPGLSSPFAWPRSWPGEP